MRSDNLTECNEGSMFCHPKLLFLDDFDPKLLAVGVFVCFAISWCLAVLGSLVFAVLPGYRDLPNQSRWIITSLGVGGVLSVPALSFGVYLLLSNELAGVDVVTGKVPMGGLIAVIVCGYHCFDLSKALILPTSSFNLLHHTGSVVMSSLTCMYGKPLILMLRFMMVDMSLPVFIRLLLSYGDTKRSKVWRMWMYCLIHLYHIRSVTEVSVWFFIVSNWQTMWKHLPPLYITAICYHLAFLTFYYTPYLVHKHTAILYRSDLRNDTNTVAANGAGQPTQNTRKDYAKR